MTRFAGQRCCFGRGCRDPRSQGCETAWIPLTI